VAFLIHQFLGTWGLFVAVPLVLMFVVEVSARVGLRVHVAQMQSLLYGTPFFPAQTALALVVGWVLGGTLQDESMLWVWILPFASLCTSRMGVPLIVRGPSQSYMLFALSSKLEYSWGRFGVYSLQQVVRIALLHIAVAYSAGGLLAFRVVRAPAFFESMKSLRKMRLLLLVGLPWLCFKFLMSWPSVSAQIPEARRSAGLHQYLGALGIVSVFLMFVFAIGVSLAGRRFAVTRFFLNPSKSPAGADPRTLGSAISRSDV
jgi:hypothetical protein